MPKKAHTEEQIVAALRQGEAGEKVGDICRKVRWRERKPSEDAAGQHYSGQWQRVQQSCAGSLGDG